MEVNLVVSLDIARKILEIQKTELRMLTTILQKTKSLSDELIVLLAESCNTTTKRIADLEKVIASLQEQKRIFGNTGLPKELEIAPKEDYPDAQQPENI